SLLCDCLFLLIVVDSYVDPRPLHSFPTRRSSDLLEQAFERAGELAGAPHRIRPCGAVGHAQFLDHQHEIIARDRVEDVADPPHRSEEHTSELQSRENLVCRLLLEKKTSTLVRSIR